MGIGIGARFADPISKIQIVGAKKKQSREVSLRFNSLRDGLFSGCTFTYVECRFTEVFLQIWARSRFFPPWFSKWARGKIIGAPFLKSLSLDANFAGTKHCEKRKK